MVELVSADAAHFPNCISATMGRVFLPLCANRVFEPLFTTHSRGPALGLYIARELCKPTARGWN